MQTCFGALTSLAEFERAGKELCVRYSAMARSHLVDCELVAQPLLYARLFALAPRLLEEGEMVDLLQPYGLDDLAMWPVFQAGERAWRRRPGTLGADHAAGGPIVQCSLMASRAGGRCDLLSATAAHGLR